MTCTKIQMRAENLSPEIKRKRYDYSREYKERQRRANGVPIRTLHNPRFDGKRLAAWLDERITLREVVGSGKKHRTARGFLNGVAMTTTDTEFVRHLRSGQIKFATLQRVDELAIRYDLPLWEMQEAAQRQRKDRRRRKIKKSA